MRKLIITSLTSLLLNACTVETEPEPDELQQIWNVMFAPGLDLTACGQSFSWSSMGLEPDIDGVFDETWSATNPNTLRISGTLDESSINAELSCVTGDGTGSFSTTNRGIYYEGTATLGGLTTGIMITPEEVETVSIQGTVRNSQDSSAVAGAVVTASVDSTAQATSTEYGQFFLQTSSPKDFSSTDYVIRAAAPGYSDYEGQSVGDYPLDTNIYLDPL